jgi:tetratricopeptide (TPR) repeat protein
LSAAVKSNRKQRAGAAVTQTTKRRHSLLAPIIALAAGLALIAIFAAPWKRPSPASGSTPPAAVTTNPPVPALQAVSAPVDPNGPLVDPGLPDSDKVAILVNRGTDLFQRGSYQEAATHYVEAIKLAPEDEATHFNLGLALAKLGKTAEAKQAYLEALRLFPDYAEAHNNLGNLLANQGQLTEAAEHLTTAVTLSPDSASAQNNLGALLTRQGKFAQAFTNFAEAVRLMPDYVEARCNLGHAYLVQGKSYEAAAEFQEALRLKPDFEPAKRGMARVTQQRPVPLAPVPLKP